VTDTLFATDASASAHEGEVILVTIGDAEYALPPSAARTFVDDLAAVVKMVDDDEAASVDEELPTPVEEQASPEDLPGDDTPEPRELKTVVDRVLHPAGDDAPKRISVNEDRTTAPDPLEFEPGEEVTVAEAAENSAGLHCYLGVDVVGAVQERVATVADRVTVRECGETYELAPGESDEWPDYTVGASSITVGAPGCRVLGIDAGDEVSVIAREDALELEPLVDEDDDPLAGAADWTPDERELDSEQLEDHNLSRAGGSSNPDAGPSRECQNCGSAVSAQYVKVNEPDGVEQPRCCPNCEDLVRDGNGVRESRT